MVESSENPFEALNILDKYTRNLKIPGSLIYHYTNKSSAKSIKSMINQKRLNFWHMKHEYDTHEHNIEEINSFYSRAIDRISGQFSSEIVSKLRHIKVDNLYYFFSYHTTKDTGEAYICSFSTKRDDKTLWERFDKDNSGMEMLALYLTDYLAETDWSFEEEYRHYVLKIIYDDEEKVEFIVRFLLELLNCKNLDGLNYCVSSFLNVCHYIFKPSDYIDESEIRSIIILKKHKSEFWEAQSNERGEPAHFPLIIDSVDYAEKYSIKKYSNS